MGEDSLFNGEPEVLRGGEKSDVAPSLSQSGRPLATPASLGAGKTACSWKGMALAERLLNWCIEASHS